MTFEWNTVIDGIVALENTGALLASGISILDATPDPLDECKTPVLFPTDDPAVTLISQQKFSGSGKGLKREKSVYQIAWVYLHTEFVQNLDKAAIRVAIRAALSSVFLEIVRHSNTLGVEYVKPVSLSVDTTLTSPASGKRYLGATFAIECSELMDITQP